MYHLLFRMKGMTLIEKIVVDCQRGSAFLDMRSGYSVDLVVSRHSRAFLRPYQRRTNETVRSLGLPPAEVDGGSLRLCLTLIYLSHNNIKPYRVLSRAYSPAAPPGLNQGLLLPALEEARL